MSTTTILSSTAPSPSGLLNLKIQNVPSKIHFERFIHSFTITTYQNIEVVELMVMSDWQISVHRLAYEFPIPITTVYEIMSNHLDTKKISTR